MIFSIEAEQAVLGGLMLDNRKLEDLSGVITADDFYRADHKLIMEIIESLSAKNKPMDPVTVAERLDESDMLDTAGGIGYLVELCTNTPSAGNIAAYAHIVADRAMERHISDTAGRIHAIAHGDGDVDDKLNLVHSEFAGLERNQNVEVTDFNVLLKSEIEDIDGRFRKIGKPGLKIGFAALDERFGGIEDTDLWVMAARPAQGKTTLALNIADNVAAQGGEVLIFSLEMSKEQLTKKLLSAAAQIPYSVLRSGDFKEADWPKLTTGAVKLKDKKIHIVDTPGLDVNRALAIARKFSRGGNLKLIIIDYLQLMTARSQTRFDEISHISRQLKVMAKTTKCPVMALSQLSRKCDERANKRPVNSDLRESGQIEQDADIITFIYRDETYNSDSPDKGVAEVITSKFRNGECGTDGIAAVLQYSRFEDLNYHYQQRAGAEESPRRKKLY